MRLPTIHGLIDRRLLINFRVDPQFVTPWLPVGISPQLVQGHAIVGICLIRLKQIRPVGLPRWLGIGSENMAHRVAIESPPGSTSPYSVYIARRDTNSRLNALVGGRLFPGEHHHSTFTVHESGDQIAIHVLSHDQKMEVRVSGTVGRDLRAGSVFASMDEISEFHRNASCGYSPTSGSERLDSLEMNCQGWHCEPFDVAHFSSTFYDDAQQFPLGSIVLDSALCMHQIEHKWLGRPDYWPQK
ncbi:MAG: DUF2071 domain-containing protein [Planctomycetota bacterium]|nr:DUF2071 domain-containing protein [Planctomycetota bacterium]